MWSIAIACLAYPSMLSESRSRSIVLGNDVDHVIMSNAITMTQTSMEVHPSATLSFQHSSGRCKVFVTYANGTTYVDVESCTHSMTAPLYTTTLYAGFMRASGYGTVHVERTIVHVLDTSPLLPPPSHPPPSPTHPLLPPSFPLDTPPASPHVHMPPPPSLKPPSPSTTNATRPSPNLIIPLTLLAFFALVAIGRVCVKG